MRAEGATRKFGDTSARLRAEVTAYREQIARGEAKPPKTDADGNIISSPSTLEPNPIRDADLPFISAHIG